MVHQLTVEGNGGVDAFDDELVEGALHTFDGLLTRSARDNELGDHAIVVGRNRVARVHVRIDPNAVATRSVKRRDLAGARAEVVVGVFRVDAAFDGVLLGLVISA